MHRKPGCQCLPESIGLPEVQGPDIAIQLPALGLQSYLTGSKSLLLEEGSIRSSMQHLLLRH